MGTLSGFAKRIELTLDSDKIDAALSGFPVPIHITASCFFDELDAGGENGSYDNRKKIAVTLSDGTTQCYVEIDYWGDYYESAWLHVLAPSVSNTVDPKLYLYYGASASDNDSYVGDTDDAVVYNIYDSYFKAVWHMSQVGTSKVTLDSTSNANDLTQNQNGGGEGE